MARPQNDGLAYFPFDVDFFSDRKVKIIRGSDLGSDGLVIYLYLLCEIYRDSGYYIDFDDDLVCCASADTGIPEGKTRQIIKLLVDKSLFDNTRFTADKVLTATSVQRRYQEAKKASKREVVVKANVWILNSQETLGFIKVHPSDSFSEENPCFSEKNPCYSENNDIKESKEKKRKEKKSKDGCTAHALTLEEKALLVSEFGKSNVEAYIGKMERWKQKRNIAITIDEFSWLSKCLKQDNPAVKDNSSSFDVDELEKKALGKYRKDNI